MEKRQKIRFISSLVSLFFTAALLIISIFGWYAVSKTAYVKNGTAATSNSEQVHFNSIIGKRYSLSGDLTINTYSVIDRVIILTHVDSYNVTAFKNASDFATEKAKLLANAELSAKEKVLYTRGDHDDFTPVSDAQEFDLDTIYYEYLEKTEFGKSDDTSFKSLNMLPGEYVDITLGFSMEDTLDGAHYFIQLNDMTGGEFVVDDHKHYASGAYCFKKLSLASEDEDLGLTPDTKYTFFNQYQIDKDDEKSINAILYEGVWNKEYDEVFFTFRVMEDFTQFYELLGKSEKTYSNLLNQLHFNIGSIFILV